MSTKNVGDQPGQSLAAPRQSRLGRRSFLGTSAGGTLSILATTPPKPAGAARTSAETFTQAPHYVDRTDEFTSWHPWLQRLLRVAHKSPVLTRKGWMPDRRELGIASLRIYLAVNDLGLTYTLRPAGADPSIRIDVRVPSPSRPGQLETVVGDWLGDAAGYWNAERDPATVGQMRMWLAETARMRGSSMQVDEPPSLNAAYRALERAEWWARSAVAELRANIRYRHRLLLLAEAVALNLPVGLRKELEEAQMVTLPLLVTERERVAKGRSEFWCRYETLLVDR